MFFMSFVFEGVRCWRVLPFCEHACNRMRCDIVPDSVSCAPEVREHVALAAHCWLFRHWLHAQGAVRCRNPHADAVRWLGPLYTGQVRHNDLYSSIFDTSVFQTWHKATPLEKVDRDMNHIEKKLRGGEGHHFISLRDVSLDRNSTPNLRICFGRCVAEHCILGIFLWKDGEVIIKLQRCG